MKKKPYWIIGAVAMIIIAAYLIFLFEFHSASYNSDGLSPLPTPTPISDKSINFNHIGNFQMSDPKLKSNEFYLIYEAPGTPAMTVRLYFNSKTICQDYSGESLCPSPLFGNGARIQVLGTQVKNYVIVKRIVIP